MNLICCSCGGQAPSRRQWWNRDTGYGICPSCFEKWVEKLGIEEAIRSCGVPGIHHTIKERLPADPVDAVIQAMQPAPKLPDHARERLQKKVREILKPVIRPEFNEADCGGVFDGFQVTSDADPGL